MFGRILAKIVFRGTLTKTLPNGTWIFSKSVYMLSKRFICWRTKKNG